MKDGRIYSDQETYPTFLRSSFDFYNRLNLELKREYNIFVADIREFLRYNETIPPAFTTEIKAFINFDNKNKSFSEGKIDENLREHITSPLRFFDFHKNILSDHTKNHLFQAVKLFRYFNAVDVIPTKERGEFVSHLKVMVENVTGLLLAGAKKFPENKLKYFEFENKFSGINPTNFADRKNHQSVQYIQPYKAQLEDFQKLNQVMGNILEISAAINSSVKNNSELNNIPKLHDRLNELSTDLEKTHDNLKENFETFIQVGNYFELAKPRKKVSEKLDLVLTATNLSLLGDSKIVIDSSIPDFQRQYTKVINKLIADQQFEILNTIENINKEKLTRLKLDTKDLSSMISQVSQGRF